MKMRRMQGLVLGGLAFAAVLATTATSDAGAKWNDVDIMCWKFSNGTGGSCSFSIMSMARAAKDWRLP